MRTHIVHRSRLTAVLLVTVMAVLAGCGGTKQSSGATGASQTPSVPSSPAPPPPTAAAQPAASAQPSPPTQPVAVAKPAAPAPKPPTTPAEIFMYKGSDRQAILEAGARKEGKLVWYGTQTQVEGMKGLEMFQKKYPFIKGEMFRGPSDTVTAKLLSERRAGVQNADIVMDNLDESAALQQEGIFAEFYSPATAHLHPKMVWPNTERSLWSATDLLVNVVSYNTTLVKPGELPDEVDYETLGDPRWKGRMALDPRDFMIYGTLEKQLGAERATRILQGWANNNPMFRKGHALLSQLQAAGEFAMDPFQYLHIVVREAGKGAKIAYKTYKSGSITVPKSVYIMKLAPHPHAAMLFMDYLMGEEYQKMLAESEGERPVAMPKFSKGLKASDYDKLIMIDPIDAQQNGKRYQEKWDSILGIR